MQPGVMEFHHSEVGTIVHGPFKNMKPLECTHVCGRSKEGVGRGGSRTSGAGLAAYLYPKMITKVADKEGEFFIITK